MSFFNRFKFGDLPQSGTWPWPQKIAQVCPVCNGVGRLIKNPGEWTEFKEPMEKTCHGCDGKGWVKA